MSRRRSVTGRAGAGLAGLLAAAVGLTGCFTGDRPTLGSAPAPTGDANADAVLERLERAVTATFSARYEISTPLGDEAEATVEQAGGGRRTVTIGPTAYIVDGDGTATCDLTTTPTTTCTDSIDAARVSNLAVTPEFYAASAAARLRSDVARRVGSTTASNETIAGQPTTCVAVPVADSQVSICALDSGPLARLAGTDVTIELVELVEA